LDAEAARGGVLFGDQIFCAPGKVIEDVLLAPQHAGLVPGLAIGAAAAEVGHRVGSAQLEPDGEHGIESGGDGDVESAIGVKNGGMGAVPSKVAAGNDEHGNFGPVFGGVENLFDIVRSRVKSDGRFEEHRGGVAAQVVAINGGRIKKGR